MPNFEQMATEANSGDNVKKEDIQQVFAQAAYDKSQPEETKRFGPPNPENYKEAEERVNSLFEAVGTEKNWGTAVGILRKGLVLLGIPRDIFSTVVDAAMQDGFPREERQPFLKALRQEALKRVSEGGRQWKDPSFANQLETLKQEAKKLRPNENNEKEK